MEEIKSSLTGFKRTKKKDFKKKEVPNNVFAQDAYKKSNETKSANGSKKYRTTGSEFLDDFASLSRYKDIRETKNGKAISWGRKFSEIFATMQKLYSIDKLKALRLTAYIRAISRLNKMPNGESVPAKGQGLKQEFFGRMLYIAVFDPKKFLENIREMISFGCWKDLFKLLEYDLILQWDEVLSSIGAYKPNRKGGTILYWDSIFKIIKENLNDDLLKKYLPQIKSKSNVSTIHNQAQNIIAKKLAIYLFQKEYIELKDRYRKTDKKNGEKRARIAVFKMYLAVKVSGKAHKWQQQITNEEYGDIDFKKIPGKALSLINKSKFVENHDLKVEFTRFVKKAETINTTSYPHELAGDMAKVLGYTVSGNMFHEPMNGFVYDKTKAELISKQFFELVRKLREGGDFNMPLLVCKDTSGSMNGVAKGNNGISSAMVANAMAMMISYADEGIFHNTMIGFNSTPKVTVLTGNPIEDFFADIEQSESTNFVSVAELMVSLRRNHTEDKFPCGILCFSDGEFNSVGSNTTNIEKFRSILRREFSEDYVDNFKFIFWDVPNNSPWSKNTGVKFESCLDNKNVYYMSGFDPSGISFIVENKNIKGAEELMDEVLNQEAFKNIH